MLKSSGQTRRRILDAAYRLFFSRGFQMAAVHEIADAAGVTKRTLYNHFPSKDDLVTEVLAGQLAGLEAEFLGWRADPPRSPAEVVRRYFAFVRRQIADPDWLTSGFTRVAMELAWAPQHPARREAARVKRRLEGLLGGALAAASADQPERAARQIALLLEGALVLRLIHGDSAYIDAAEATALALADTRG